MVEGALTGLPLLSLAEIAAFRVAGMTDTTHEDERVRVAAVGLLRMCDTIEAFRAALSGLADEIDQNLGVDVRHSSAFAEALRVLDRTPHPPPLSSAEEDEVRWLVRHIAECEMCQDRAKAHRE